MKPESRNISLKIYWRKETAKRNGHYKIALEEIEGCIADQKTVENETIFDRKRGVCMNAKKFSDAMSELDTKYADEALKLKKKAKKTGWIKWGAVAACLIMIVGIVFWGPTTHDGRRVISEYHTNSSGSYAAPSPGEAAFTSAVREARKKYEGKNVSFLLGFSIFKDDGEKTVQLSEEERIAEYQRLISLGYELYTAESWTYQGKGEKRYYTVVVGYFTESELSLFAGNPEYGYMFDFVTNGDGSSIPVKETDVITNFPTNYS